MNAVLVHRNASDAFHSQQVLEPFFQAVMVFSDLAAADAAIREKPTVVFVEVADDVSELLTLHSQCPDLKIVALKQCSNVPVRTAIPVNGFIDIWMPLTPAAAREAIVQLVDHPQEAVSRGSFDSNSLPANENF